MSIVLDFFNTLDKDAAARETHIKDPKASMMKYGLTDTDQAALMSGDKKEFAAAAGVSDVTLVSVQVPHVSF